MQITQLRKMGSSVMLTLPQAFLDQLHLDAGARVELTIEDGRLIIKPAPPPRYTLDELIAASDPATWAAIRAANMEDIWMTGGPVGKELL